MKKYVKPVAYFESFELTQHIAGSCGDKGYILKDSGNGTLSGSRYDEPINYLFEGDNVSCVVKEYDYCYTKSSDTLLNDLAFSS